jgi:hypothetical protein
MPVIDAPEVSWDNFDDDIKAYLSKKYPDAKFVMMAEIISGPMGAEKNEHSATHEATIEGVFYRVNFKARKQEDAQRRL